MVSAVCRANSAGLDAKRQFRPERRRQLDARRPIRSLYHFRLLLALCDELGFDLCQKFFWYNPAKMPAPAEWVNVRRIRVKDSVEYIFWLSASKFPKADNSPRSPSLQQGHGAADQAGHQANETPLGS